MAFDAQVTGAAEGKNSQGVAAGTVTFEDGSTTLGTANVSGNGNLASWPGVSAKPEIPGAGSYNFTASYTGDASYNSGTSAPVPVTVTPGMTTLTISNAPSIVGGVNPTVPLFAAVSTPYNLGAAPTGTVGMTVNGQNAGTISGLAVGSQTSGPMPIWLLSGSATIATNYLRPGSNVIGLTYSGDANYSSSTQTVTVDDRSGVGSFTLTNGGDVALTAGEEATVNIAVNPTGGFYSSVNLSISALPSGITFGGEGTVYVFTAQPVSTPFNLGTSYTMAPGTYPITITGTDSTGKITASTTINVVVSGLPSNAGISLTGGGAVSIAGGSLANNNASVTLTPTNGFVGQVSFTCAITTSMTSVSGVPNCQGFSQGFPSSSAATFQIPITTYKTTTPGSYTVNVTATDVNNTAITAATTIPLTVTAFDGVLISINPFVLTVGAGAATGNTLTMILQPSGGYTGMVNLECDSLTLPPGAASPVVCVVPSTVSITGANPITETLTANTTADTTLGTYTFGINVSDAATGTWYSGTDISVNVQAGPSLALSNSGNITVTPGATTGNTSTISITPANGFTGAVNLSCKLTSSPPGASDLPTCSVPASVTISGATAATATLTLTTTAPGSSALELPLRKFFIAGGGSVLAVVLFFGIPARRRGWRALFSVLAVIVIAGAVGCGGGSGAATGGGTGGGGGGGGGTPNPGTTPGQYTVVVTGADAATGKITSSVTVNVTVN